MLLFKFFVVDFLIHVINGVMEAKRRTQNVRPVQSFFSFFVEDRRHRIFVLIFLIFRSDTARKRG